MGHLLRLFRLVCSSLNMLGALAIVGMMLLIVADVVGRAVFGRPLMGVPEIVKLAVVAIAWLQMAYTLQIGGHLRTTILVDMLPPVLARLAEVLAGLLGIIVFMAVAYSEWPNVIEAWRIGDFEGDAPMRIPTAPIHTIVLTGAVLTAFQFLLLVLESIGLKQREMAPTSIVAE